jgi:uncharacterized membrane protein YvbJ
MPAKRCPMCHTVHEDRDWQCRKCGYEFGQSVERVRELLRDQLTNAKIALVLLIIVDLGMLALPIYGVLARSGIIMFPGIFSVVFLTRWTVKNAQKISISRQSLRSLADQEKRAELPKATLHSG